MKKSFQLIMLCVFITGCRAEDTCETFNSISSYEFAQHFITDLIENDTLKLKHHLLTSDTVTFCRGYKEQKKTRNESIFEKNMRAAGLKDTILEKRLQEKRLQGPYSVFYPDLNRSIEISQEIQNWTLIDKVDTTIDPDFQEQKIRFFFIGEKGDTMSFGVFYMRDISANIVPTRFFVENLSETANRYRSSLNEESFIYYKVYSKLDETRTNLEHVGIQISNESGYDIDYLKFRVELALNKVPREVFASQTIELRRKIFDKDIIDIKVKEFEDFFLGKPIEHAIGNHVITIDAQPREPTWTEVVLAGLKDLPVLIKDEG
jgi:hypothetical protein